MKLDNYEVHKGDKLFDIDVRGVVTCQVANEDAIICQTVSNGRRLTLTYNTAGRVAGYGKRVLYWQNPLVIIPPKNPAHWTAQCDVLKSTLRTMQNYARTADPTIFDDSMAIPAIASITTAHERGLLNEQDLGALLDELKDRTD